MFFFPHCILPFGKHSKLTMFSHLGGLFWSSGRWNEYSSTGRGTLLLEEVLFYWKRYSSIGRGTLLLEEVPFYWKRRLLYFIQSEYLFDSNVLFGKGISETV